MRLILIRVGGVIAVAMVIAAIVVLVVRHTSNPWVAGLVRIVGLNHAGNPPVSPASYDEVDRAVGCRSHLTTGEKDTVFEREYRDRSLTWTGQIAYIRADEIGLRLRPTSDAFELRVSLADRRASFRLALSDQANVRFVLRGRGDCGRPFVGDSGMFEAVDITRGPAFDN